MTPATAGAVLAGVALTPSDQLLMKCGMSSDGVRAAIATEQPVAIVTQVALSPWVIGGLACFVLSVGLWLSVLSKLNVSQAYPCVALGFVMTMLGGHFIFDEVIGLARIAGLALIVSGVGIVALS